MSGPFAPVSMGSPLLVAVVECSAPRQPRNATPLLLDSGGPDWILHEVSWAAFPGTRKENSELDFPVDHQPLEP